jgi:hypothetical protein
MLRLERLTRRSPRKRWRFRTFESTDSLNLFHHQTLLIQAVLEYWSSQKTRRFADQYHQTKAWGESALAQIWCIILWPILWSFRANQQHQNRNFRRIAWLLWGGRSTLRHQSIAQIQGRKYRTFGPSSLLDSGLDPYKVEDLQVHCKLKEGYQKREQRCRF